MQVIETKSKREKVRRVKKLMNSIGNQIGAVWFYKRSDGSLRRMAFRNHVIHPTYEKEPTGEKFLYKKAQDAEKDLKTVFDLNVMRYNNKGRICGRGGFRSVPMENVIRLKVGGTIYRFV
jgi:hypothetical protein